MFSLQLGWFRLQYYNLKDYFTGKYRYHFERLEGCKRHPSGRGFSFESTRTATQGTIYQEMYKRIPIIYPKLKKARISKLKRKRK